MAQSDSTELARQRLFALAQEIANDDKYSGTPWSGITVVVTMVYRPDIETVKKYFGYVYTDGPVKPDSGSLQRWEARTPSRDSSAPAFVALAKAIAERDDREPWKRCLFQLDRESGAVNVEFSYDETHPWNPDFADLDEWVERLRPPSGPSAS